MSTKSDPESVVREIKRRTRRKFSTEEKIRKEAVRQLGRTNNPEARRVLEELLRIGRP